MYFRGRWDARLKVTSMVVGRSPKVILLLGDYIEPFRNPFINNRILVRCDAWTNIRENLSITHQFSNLGLISYANRLWNSVMILT